MQHDTINKQHRDGATAPCPASAKEVSHRDNLLAALRYAKARMDLASNDLNFVGVALSRGLVSVEYAIDWLGELGALPLIQTTFEVAHV